MAKKTECPTCERAFQKPGLHWRQGACPYPVFTSIQREILEGVLFKHGSIVLNNDQYRFSIQHSNEGFIHELGSELGIHASRISIDNRKNSYTGEPSELHTLFSRPHPDFERYRSRFYTADARVVPEDFSVSPRTLAYAFALAGWVCSRGYVCLPFPSESPSDTILDLFSMYDPSIRYNGDGYPLVALNNRERFFYEVGLAESNSGYAVPGFADKLEEYGVRNT